EKANESAFGKINDFASLCKQNRVSFVCLTSSTKEAIKTIKEENNLEFDFYNTDGTVLKTMVRSNPGLMLLKGGTVIGMWHHHTIPSFNDVKEMYFKK
ncbi:MAG: hypothetical protein JNL69_07170, partial [Bacteroidia bacterium]|nr:hypothetical protein [Bacteroidia bacterium]